MADTGWKFENGGLAAGNVGNAPVYDDVLSSFLGQTYFTPGKYDAALATTLNAGGQGSLSQGLDAFIKHGTDDSSDLLNNAAAAGYKTEDLKNLATGFGIDPNSANLEQQLRDRTANYYGIGGMSAGWNPTGDARQGNQTLYERRDGKLVPIQTNTGVYPEKGNWVQEHPGILAPLAVVGGGLAYGALAGAGAGGGAASTAATTAGSAGGSGLGGLAGSAQSMWAGLPGWGQGALSGAAQGGISSAVQGKNILRGALMGGLTGGVGAVGGQFLSNATGMPLWGGRALTSAGLGGLTGGWKGALGAGLGSLASSGLSEAGLPSQASGYLGGLAGRFGGGLLGGALGLGGGAPGGAGGSSQGGSGGSAGARLSGYSAAASGGGLSGGLRVPKAGAATAANEQDFYNTAYAPMFADAAKKKLASELAGKLQSGDLSGLT